MIQSAVCRSPVRLTVVPIRLLSTPGGVGQKRRDLVERIIRVDHAGEFGADRIYAGQMAILGKTELGSTIKHMWEEEVEHLRTFEQLVAKGSVRPTLLLPIYSLAGYLLGATTALMGSKAAMACTIAVEETITDHYNDQIRELMEDDPVAHKDLLGLISKFRDDEANHHDIGVDHEGEKVQMFPILKGAIQTGCKAAIWVSERI